MYGVLTYAARELKVLSQCTIGHKHIRFQHYKSELDHLAKILNTIVHSQIMFYLTRDYVISKGKSIWLVNPCIGMKKQNFQTLA